MCEGLVTSYAGLVVVRAILGAIEGPMFPGIVLYLSGFYTRRDLSLRSVRNLNERFLVLFSLLKHRSVLFSGIGKHPHLLKSIHVFK